MLRKGGGSASLGWLAPMPSDLAPKAKRDEPCRGVVWEWTAGDSEVRFAPTLGALLGGEGIRRGSGEALAALIHDEDRPLAVKILTSVMGGGAVTHELRARSDDGWRRLRVTAVGDPERRRITGTAVEVAPRTEAVDDHTIAAAIFANADWGIAVGSANAARIEACNPAFARERGYAVDALVGRSILDLFPPEVHEAVLAEIARAHVLGHHTYESLNVRRDGSTFPVRVEVTAVRDDDGVVLYRIVRSEDLSAQRAEEARAQLRDARLRALYEHSPIAVFLYGPEGRVEDVNPAGLALLGTVERKAVACLLLWESPSMTPAIRARLEAGEVVHLQSTLDFDRARELSLFSTTRTGIAVLEWVVTPIAGLGFMAQIVEITERVRAEIERERLAAELGRARRLETVGRLAGGLAHEFNNVLAVISMRAELAQGYAPSGSPLHRHLEGIVTTSARAVESLRHLLGFARKQPAAPRVLDLGASIAAMAPMLRRMIGEGITIELAVAPGLWPVFLDPAQLDQVIVNLCLNARDALGDRGRIAIAVANAAEGGASMVSLVVRDDGPGMQAEVMERLFEPFFTTKPVGKGTGLGLATVHAIVQQNGGAIEVESAGGRGTTVRIWLPRCEAVEAGSSEATAAAAAPHGRGETILLVEDRDDLREATREALCGLGYAVLAPARPLEALRVAEEHAGPIDLLVSDVIMPEMDGPTLHRRLMRLRPEVPVLYISGHSGDRSGRMDLVAAGVEVLRKPFTLAVLAARVRAHLDDQGPPERVT